MGRSDYYLRLVEAYLLRRASHLDFWRELPEVNPRATTDRLGEYYLLYRQKAQYPGPLDPSGIPLLNYRGRIGLQYNPIAIAQFGLAHFNRSEQTHDAECSRRFLLAATWLADHLERTSADVEVWNHHFEWPYRLPLRPPWASALSQGQGISLLVRAAEKAGNPRYLESARRALRAFELSVPEGGVAFRDGKGGFWLEEYPVDPPSHILNGAIAASWGLFDYWLCTREGRAKALFDQAIATLLRNLHRYDIGFWSLYELPDGGRIRMPASSLYHRLHIAQLRILARMTGESFFSSTADRWERYLANFWCRTRARCEKIFFKLFFY